MKCSSRPEVELLLCCARPRLTPAQAARVESLVRFGLDWTYVRRAAGRHGLRPLLYRHLNDVAANAVPHDFMADLEEHFGRNARHNLLLAGELVRLAEMLEGEGVTCAAFKGPALAASLYGDIALRESTDLDILVARRDVPRAVSLLESASYEPLPRLSPAQESFYVRTQCERTFARRDGKVFVDLHWAITPDVFPFRAETDDLLGRAAATPLAGASVKTLDPTDLLLVLCVNAAKKWFLRLEWLCGIAELLRSGAVDWPRASRAAKELRAERLLHMTLALAHDLLEVELPTDVLENLKGDLGVAREVRLARERLVQDAPPLTGALEKSRWRFRMFDRRSDALRATLKAAVRPNLPDWKWVSLPAPLFFLYYLLRPVRLAFKHGRGPAAGK
ncbi:MAG: nucleotidyltransferase family protein [Acidobacteriota bacterium]|nr:nucleotidyltransferase family protein [Acidobacteriota bacterium]